MSQDLAQLPNLVHRTSSMDDLRENMKKVKENTKELVVE